MEQGSTPSMASPFPARLRPETKDPERTETFGIAATLSLATSSISLRVAPTEPITECSCSGRESM